MARYTGPVCRLCRRERMKLFLKGSKCETDKCPIERRGYPPGEHGRDRRPKESDYGTQLREKQKARRIYGVLERSFRTGFAKAARQGGVTGENLLANLERRLDNVVFRMGFAPSRNAARQLVLHKHMTINGRVVNIPSYMVSANEIISVRDKSRKLTTIQDSLERRGGRNLPEWIEVDVSTMTGRVRMMPARSDIQVPVQEQLIVELYSK